MTSGVNLTFSSKCDIMKVRGASRVSAFFCAILRAFSEMSVAVMLASGSSFLRVMAMQPEPVPTSRILGCAGRMRFGAFMPGR